LICKTDVFAFGLENIRTVFVNYSMQASNIFNNGTPDEAIAKKHRHMDHVCFLG